MGESGEANGRPRWPSDLPPPPAPGPGAPGGPPPVFQGYGQGPPGYGASGYGPPPTTTNTKAVVSLVLGIASIAASCVFVTGIPAIVLGHQARREIRASQGREQGDPMALAGIITGWIGTALGVLAVALIIVLVAIAPPTTNERFVPVGGPSGGINTDPSDGRCNPNRYWQDPDC